MKSLKINASCYDHQKGIRGNDGMRAFQRSSRHFGGPLLSAWHGMRKGWMMEQRMNTWAKKDMKVKPFSRRETLYISRQGEDYWGNSRSLLLLEY